MAYIFAQTCCSYPTDGFVLIFVISLYLSLLIEARETEARVMLTFMALDNSEKQKDGTGNELKKTYFNLVKAKFIVCVAVLFMHCIGTVPIFIPSIRDMTTTKQRPNCS